MRGYTLKSSRWYLAHLLDQPWTERAACIRHPRLPWTEDTQPNTNDHLEMATVCANCPVLAQCAEYALTGHDGGGVEGGFYAGVWIPWSAHYTHAATAGRTAGRAHAYDLLNARVSR